MQKNFITYNAYDVVFFIIPIFFFGSFIQAISFLPSQTQKNVKCFFSEISKTKAKFFLLQIYNLIHWVSEGKKATLATDSASTLVAAADTFVNSGSK